MSDKSFGLLKLDLVEIKYNACKNYMNNSVICNECINVCPSNALKLKNKIPMIDYDKCTNCGLCISTCKVLAFDNKKRKYSDIIKQITDFPDSNITCEEAFNYVKGIKIPCYLNIDFNLLCKISDYKDTVTFYLGSCSSCFVSNIEAVIEHFTNLQKELDYYSIPLTINLRMKKMKDTNDRFVEGLTRRELLKKLSLQELREFKFPDQRHKKRKVSKKDSNRKRILIKRDLFNNTLEKNENTANVELPDNQFLTINELEKCNGCGICEKICPTGAIKWEDNNQSSNLIFNSKDCIACKKCLACPENAIKYSSITVNEYLTFNKMILATVNLSQCVQCGDEFRSNINESICPLCKIENDKQIKSYFN